jgi:hypothetical protein
MLKTMKSKKQHTKEKKKAAKKGYKIASRVPGELRSIIEGYVGHRVPTQARTPQRALEELIDNTRERGFLGVHPRRTSAAMGIRRDRAFREIERENAKRERRQSISDVRFALNRAAMGLAHKKHKQQSFGVTGETRAAMDRVMGGPEPGANISEKVVKAVMDTLSRAP